MAYIVIEISVPNASIADLNGKVQRPGKPHAAVANLENLCSALLAGAADGSVQVTTRDTTASISTSGSGSQQEAYNLL